MPRKNYLEAVRAVAAFMVIVVHTQQCFPATSTPVIVLASMGQLGVQLFFVTSAFLIFDSLQRLETKCGSLIEFFIHRFLRIAPLYYFALAISLLYWSQPTHTAFNITANILFIHNLFPGATNGVVGGGWSIGAEMLFYAAAPALFALRRNVAALALIGAICMHLTYIATGLQPLIGEASFVLDNSYLYFSILNQMPVFLCGCIAFCYRDRLLAAPFAVIIPGWLAPIAIIYYIWTRYFGSPMTFAYVPLLAGVSSVFLMALMSKIASWPRVVTEFGKRSFSLYLWNLPALLLVLHLRDNYGLKLSFPAAVVVVASVALAGSLVTYRLIEQPFIDLAKRLTSSERKLNPIAV